MPAPALIDTDALVDFLRDRAKGVGAGLSQVGGGEQALHHAAVRGA